MAEDRLPSDKANIELVFAQKFAAAYNLSLPLGGLIITDIWQNPENSLDFRVPPEEAPHTYNPYDLGKFVHGKIMDKSRKYRSRKPGGLFLLLYLDDWRFQPSATMIALLQFGCSRKANSFEAIFYYMPLEADNGHLSVIAPTPSEYWRNFDPEQHRQNTVINFDPSKWRLSPSPPPVIFQKRPYPTSPRCKI